MYKLNNKWNKINDLGPMQYYLYDGEQYKGGILKYAKIIPPLSNDNILHAVKNDWLHLRDHEKKIFVYDSTYSTNFNGDSSIYNPLICFFNYYVYDDDDDDDYDENNDACYDYDDEILETHELVLFIKKLSWNETGSEGCGWMNYNDEYEIYLARNLDDIVNFAILPQERTMFDLD